MVSMTVGAPLQRSKGRGVQCSCAAKVLYLGKLRVGLLLGDVARFVACDAARRGPVRRKDPAGAAPIDDAAAAGVPTHSCRP